MCMCVCVCVGCERLMCVFVCACVFGGDVGGRVACLNIVIINVSASEYHFYNQSLEKL